MLTFCKASLEIDIFVHLTRTGLMLRDARCRCEMRDSRCGRDVKAAVEVKRIFQVDAGSCEDKNR
jgi:hypothetical protein